MDEVVITLGVLLIGWLIGLFTTPFSEKIKWHFFERKRYLRLIKSELQEIKSKYIYTNHSLVTKHFPESIDENYVIWINKVLQEIKGVNTIDGLTEAIRILTKDNYKEYKRSLILRKEEKGDFSTSLKKQQFHIVTKSLDKLQNFNEKFHQIILEILYQQNTYNEVIDSHNYLHNETFNPNHEKPNREIIKNSITQIYKNTIDQSRYMIDKIEIALNIIEDEIK